MADATPATYTTSDDPSTIELWIDKLLKNMEYAVYGWKQAQLNYRVMVGMRERYGIPLISNGWTEEHEAAIKLNALVMGRLEAMLQQAKARLRGVAGDSITGDVALLAEASELRVVVGEEDGQQAIAAAEGDNAVYLYKPSLWYGAPLGVGAAPIVIGGIAIPPVLVGVAIVAVTLVALSAIYSAYSTISGYIVRLMKRDSEQFYTDCRKKGSSDAQCQSAIASITKSVVDPIKADAERKNQDPTSKMWEAAKWGAIAVGVLGVGYLAWKFWPSGSAERTGGYRALRGSEPRLLAQENPAGIRHAVWPTEVPPVTTWKWNQEAWDRFAERYRPEWYDGGIHDQKAWDKAVKARKRA